jgi:hypothetical protein
MEINQTHVSDLEGSEQQPRKQKDMITRNNALKPNDIYHGDCVTELVSDRRSHPVRNYSTCQ